MKKLFVYFYEARKNKNSITLLYFKQPKEISSESMMLAPKDTAPLQPLMFYGPCLCSPPGWRKGACPCFSLHLQTIEPFWGTCQQIISHGPIFTAIPSSSFPPTLFVKDCSTCLTVFLLNNFCSLLDYFNIHLTDQFNILTSPFLVVTSAPHCMGVTNKSPHPKFHFQAPTQ